MPSMGTRWKRARRWLGQRGELLQLLFVRSALLWLLRVYAYLFHLALALFLFGVGIVAFSSGRSLTLGMLPWEGVTLTWAVLILGLVGIVCVGLAVTGIVRWLFPFWTLFALVMMVRGFFLSGYSFGDAAQFRFDLWLTLGALIAFFGSLSLFGRRRRP
jgi:hypothetical protein